VQDLMGNVEFVVVLPWCLKVLFNREILCVFERLMLSMQFVCV